MYIKTFDEISKDSISEVGGKAASLGELTRLGIPVSQGFVIGNLPGVERWVGDLYHD